MKHYYLDTLQNVLEEIYHADEAEEHSLHKGLGYNCKGSLMLTCRNVCSSKVNGVKF